MNDDRPLWPNMTAAQRAEAYSPSSVLKDRDLMPYIRQYIDESAAAYAAHPTVKTLRYGPLPSNTVDLVVPVSQEPVPLHVFLHGGYWQELSKKESIFPATDTLANGIAFAAVDYTLAPHASLDDIIAECRAAVRMLSGRADEFGIDPTRVVVSGSSAGAHLAAMVGIDKSSHHRLKAVVLLSGIYWLEPLVGTYINDVLGLTVSAAQRLSLAMADLAGFPETLVAYGGCETDEFKRQSLSFADILRSSGCPVATLEMPKRNHFDIVGDIANGSELGGHLLRLTKD